MSLHSPDDTLPLITGHSQAERRTADRVRATVPMRATDAAAVAVAVLLAGVMLAGAAIGAAAWDVPFGTFTRDATAVMGAEPYVGALSTIGVLGWWTGAVALAFAGLVPLRDGRSRPVAWYLTAAAGLAWLALDDALQLHEVVIPGLGAPEKVVELAYAVGAVVLVAKGRRWLAQGRWLVLACGAALLATSVTIDVVDVDGGLVWVEDGLKLAGIFVLAAFALATAYEALRAEPHRT